MSASGERLHYGRERQRHEGFVGRVALLARLDQLLIADRADRWVVVTGGPGMGKSALLAEWLKRCEAAGALVPHHFIRRGQYGWDDPAKLVGSLVAQLEERFPALCESDEATRLHPADRLARMLERVSEGELAPNNGRLIILIDGLDEYDPPTAGPPGRDPLAAFLPHTLPPGVSLLCASRPRHPYVDMLAARDGELEQIDLDAAALAADNAATVRAFWEREAPSLGLDAAFIELAVARANGNLQHAATLRKQLAGLPPDRRRAEDIPRGLGALLEQAWQRIATEPTTVTGLGILCAAREALTREEIGAVAEWHDSGPAQAFLRTARELLIETRRTDGQEEYRLHHDSIRAHIAKAIGPPALRRHHGALAQQLASWPPPKGAAAIARQYALRHALFHRVESGDWAGAWRLAADISFLEARCCDPEIGAHEAELDVARAAARCRASGDDALIGRFDGFVRALGRASHLLREAPLETAAIVWNQLRWLGWPADEIDRQLQIPADAKFLRLRHVATRESPALVRTLTGHTGDVLACAVTPDGRRVVSASVDQTLKLWDLASGRVEATLTGGTGSVLACAVTPDGRRVVSAVADQTLMVWDLASGCVETTLAGHAGRVLACAVTPDGRCVVSASADRTLKAWDLTSGHVKATLIDATGSVLACAVTPDGRRVVSASAAGMLNVWDLESGRVEATLEGHADRVRACAVTPDGRRVISASADGTLKVWDLASGRTAATLAGHADHVTACAVTPDGQRVVSASADETLKVWDVASGRVEATLTGHADKVTACAVTPDGQRVVSASADRTLKVWDLASRRVEATLAGHAAWVTACAVTPDGRRMVSASADRTLKVWDLASGRVAVTLAGDAAWVLACAVTPDGRRVVSASAAGMLNVWDLESGRVVATFAGHAARVTACAVTPDGQRVVSASADRTLKVWDLASGHIAATLEGHVDRVLACAVTPDGQCVVSASVDRTLKVWDLASGHIAATLEGHAASVNACTVTPNRRCVVSASADRTLKVWDLASGRVEVTLTGHADRVDACAVTLDGRHVVSTSEDRTLKVWDLQSCECVLTHRADAGYWAVAVTANVIVAGDTSGAVWFLDWPVSSAPGETLYHSLRTYRPASAAPADSSPPPRSLMPPIQKHTILFLAANPTETAQLALDREARAIQKELESAGFRDHFELVTRWAVEPLDLLRELRKLKPTVVHFSGHGGPSTADVRSPGSATPLRRDVVTGASHDQGNARQHGLFFQGSDGRSQFVSAEAIRETFSAAGSSVQLVVLNACYSDVQAEALIAHVNCVVGMTGAILDDAARSFAIGFYGGLGERESIEAAYRQGRAAISLEGLPDSARPQLKVRPGVDAAKLVLAADPR